MIFNIQRYSTHDGPGIRTVVFLKGCSLGCRWCQNPESRAREREVLFDARLCTEGCDLCQQVAPKAISRALNGLLIARENLTDSDLNALTDCCPTQALTVCGEDKSVEDIMATVLRDKAFIPAAAAVLPFPAASRLCTRNWLFPFKASHEHGIHTAVETCLHVPWRYIEPSVPYVDLFLADLKHVDSGAFKQWTDGSARRVLDNLKRLAQAGKQMTIRVPLIPGFNADENPLPILPILPPTN